MNLSELKQRSTYIILGIGIVVGLGIAWLAAPESTEPVETGEASAATEEEDTTWTCSMHPQIRQQEPGQCPICGMDLIPAGGKEEDAGERRLEMSESAKKLAEITTVPVERRFIEHRLRLVGKVEYDETRVKNITAWFPGRIERLFVDYTGTPVKEGEHLVDIYSPEILTDQEALLQAKKAVEQAPAASDPAVQQSRREGLKRARNRLRLLGLTDKQIQEIEERGTPSEEITYYSPITGIVIEKNALKGDYVNTGTRIYTIADLSRVWVKMDAYESDLQWIRYGQDVEFSTVAYPGDVFHGRIAFIDPFLNQNTRTVKVRVNVDNEEGKLKPDMFVRAEVEVRVTDAGRVMDPRLAGKWMCSMHPEIVKDEAGFCDLCGMPLVTAESRGYAPEETDEPQPPLVIPASSVLITGTRAVVYVEVPNTEKPTYKGREVVLGPRLGDYYMVRSGLLEGEQVVSNGNFKIDSALQIQAKPSMMSPEEVVAATEHEHPGSGTKTETVEKEPPKQMLPSHALQALLPDYLRLTNALASDSTEGAREAAASFANSAGEHQAERVHRLASEAAQSDSIETIRERYAVLSDILIRSVEANGPGKNDLYLAFCPMAFNNRGARWLQTNDEILNPYFGAAMLKCGTIEREFTGENDSETESHQH